MNVNETIMYSLLLTLRKVVCLIHFTPDIPTNQCRLCGGQAGIEVCVLTVTHVQCVLSLLEKVLQRLYGSLLVIPEFLV